ncbi:MAG: SGNH/GDSL hydrolase family protein [Kiritimatiellia bacterium]
MLAALGIAIAVLLVEFELRITAPDAVFGSARELTHFHNPDHSRQFEIDPTFGFRPILGRGMYSEFGTLTNAYPVVKRPGVIRVLFVGDSVTARGAIVEALRRKYSEERFEFWNAGVESFNTIQETEYYKRYNRAIQPDHVVLTFHMNDFETTPVVFVRPDGRLVAYAPNCPATQLNPWLFQHSRLYRWWVGAFRCGNRAIDQIVTETRRSLEEMQQLTQADGVRFSVLVLPFLKPAEEWTEGDKLTRRLALEMLQDFRIRYFDLYDQTMKAIREGVPVTETPGDSWHPSPELAERLAEYLWEQELL